MGLQFNRVVRIDLTEKMLWHVRVEEVGNCVCMHIFALPAGLCRAV